VGTEAKRKDIKSLHYIKRGGGKGPGTNAGNINPEVFTRNENSAVGGREKNRERSKRGKRRGLLTFSSLSLQREGVKIGTSGNTDCWSTTQQIKKEKRTSYPRTKKRLRTAEAISLKAKRREYCAPTSKKEGVGVKKLKRKKSWCHVVVGAKRPALIGS